MDNSLLAVRDINHKYIVVEGRRILMEILSTFFSWIEAIGIIITLGLTIYTLHQNTILSVKEQKSEILTQKRSQRIDLLRTYSSTILAEGELRILDKKIDCSALVYATNNYAALLQYIDAYIEDVELINLAHELERMIINKHYDKETLRKMLNKFYFKNDHYVAVEYSRLIQEVKSKSLDSNSIEEQKKDYEEQERKFKEFYEKSVMTGARVII